MNPGKIPVIVLDQPLYTIATKIQWHESQNFWEDKYVVLMGGLHIEMSFPGVIGEWLDGSGLSTLITKSGFITEARADSVQKGSLTSRGQWVHQVTVSVLYILIHKAYDDYKTDNENFFTFNAWCSERKISSPQFFYWLTVFD